jgi:acetate kinase
MKVLVLNCGSSSLKYKLVDTAARVTLRKGVVERLGAERTHADAIAEALAATEGQAIEAVGHRVVHGGERFHDPALITPDVLGAIEACVPLAPSHNPHNLAGIRAAQEALPDCPQVAVFDTAFHGTLPRRARTYALDQAATARGVRRYGFHGTSHAFVAEEAAKHLGRRLGELRLVTLHLGNGASACAVEHGVSTETSMGLTPLEGLVMGSRCGDLDPGVVLNLLREEGATVDSVERFLNKSSGLAGLSGIGNDLRDLEAQAAEGHDGARLAIAVFSHRVRKYVGAYAAVMGGLDAVVFTGGIGQNATAMRRRILQRLGFLGVHLDEQRNAAATVSSEARVAEINPEDASVKVLVIATDEELRIAEQTAKVARGETSVAAAEPIPVTVTTRHVHLDAASLEVLFGAGATLEPVAELTQPGVFVSGKRVDLVGPRDTLEDVPVLGPVWAQPQVEVSQADEFQLGVDAPVRASGELKGSAPITLVGPAGTVRLTEGLINPRRHLHLTPADAEARGVDDGDAVSLTVQPAEGAPVELRDVLVHVVEDARLALHLDDEEARKAGVWVGERPQACFTPAPGATAELQSRRPTLRLDRSKL